MKKTIRFTDIKIDKGGVSFVILVMQGMILLYKSKTYYVKFNRDVKIYNSTFIDMVQFIMHAWANRKVIRNYNVVVDLEPDLDVTEVRKDYGNYVMIDSLGLTDNGVSMLLDKTIDYTALTLANFKVAGLQQRHADAIEAEVSLPQTIDNAIKFNIDHDSSFQVAAMLLIDDLHAKMLFNGSVDEYKSPTYKFGTNVSICTSTFVNGALGAAMMNMKLDLDNFWKRFLDCSALPHFKDFRRLMIALCADKMLGFGYMTDERIREYLQFRQIKLDKWEKLQWWYDREFKKATPRIPSDTIIPLLNISKDFMYRFFDRAEDRQQLDAIYAMLDDPQYAEMVQECRKEFKLFDKSKLESAFGDDKTSSDAISEKMDLIEQ